MPARRILVPLIVLALAGALWLWSGSGGAPIAALPDDVGRCGKNLREIYAGLLELHQRGALPAAPEGDLLTALFQSGVWEDTAARRRLLTCPGPGAKGETYAVRDLDAFPLTKFPSGGVELEPLVSCPDTGVPAHDGCLNVLYSDGSVRTLTLQYEIESGRLPAGSENLPVGPGSPVPDLAELVEGPR